VVAPLAANVGFDYTVEVLPITVAALMSPEWIAKHWQVPAAATRVIVPGYCEGDMAPLTTSSSAPVERGPRDLRQLHAYFKRLPPPSDYGAFDIQIIAEINHCPRLALDEILRQAKLLARDGADLIDVGCDPGGAWGGVADVVRALRDEGY